MDRNAAIAIGRKVASRRANGRFAEDDRLRAEQVAAAAIDLAEQVSRDNRPATERVPEFVLGADGRLQPR